VEGNVTLRQYQNWLAGVIPTRDADIAAYAALNAAITLQKTIAEDVRDNDNNFGADERIRNTVRYSVDAEGLKSEQRYTVFVFAVSGDGGVRSIAGRSTFTTR